MSISSMALAAAALDILREEQADNSRLREALTDIRNRILCPVGPAPSLDELQEIASGALAAGSGTAETRGTAAQCEASQSGGDSRNAQPVFSYPIYVNEPQSEPREQEG